MEILNLFALLAYPIFGAIQVIDGIFRYFQKDKAPEHYRNIGRYLRMVIFYFVLLVILCVYANSLGPKWNAIEGFMLIYLFIIPLPLAIYKRYITKMVKQKKLVTGNLEEEITL